MGLLTLNELAGLGQEETMTTVSRPWTFAEHVNYLRSRMAAAVRAAAAARARTSRFQGLVASRNREAIRKIELEHLARQEVLATHRYIHSEAGQRRKRELERAYFLRKLGGAASVPALAAAAARASAAARAAVSFPSLGPPQAPGPLPLPTLLASARLAARPVPSYTPKPTGGLVRGGPIAASISPSFLQQLFD